MPTPRLAPPTSAQVALLTRTLASPDQPEGTLVFQELRGFLFGIASAPVLARPSEWVPDVFGGEGPELRTLEETELVMAALKACYNDAVSATDTDGDPIDPLRAGIDVNSEESLQLWARGFSLAYDGMREAWEEILAVADGEDREQLSAALTALSVWSHPAEFQRIQELDDVELREALDDYRKILPFALGLIAGTGRGVYEARIATGGGVPPPRRTRTAPGRNDRFPCGSGKKYKYCCLAS